MHYSIIQLILSLNQFISSANITHLLEIINGMYSINGSRVTDLSISRYRSTNYKTIQPFVATDIT